MSERKLFGTDGIRGKANVYPMTGEIAFNLGRAVTYYFQKLNKRNKKTKILLGKDTRLSCYMLEQSFSSGVCAQGGEVILTGPLPTPGVAFVAKSMRADAGIMISASHNTYSDNGIKIFDSYGYKLPDAVELEIERLLLNPELMPVHLDGELGSAKRIKEVFGRYLVHTKSALSSQFDMQGMRVVLDCANGAGYKVTPMMFEELGAEVFAIGVEPNGKNINNECGSLHPQKAQELVKTYRADMGICLDGDADRLVVIDENGAVVDGDRLIAIFAKLLMDQGHLKKGDMVVGTIMSNLGLENYLKGLGLKFHRTQVGDRYIMSYMQKTGAVLGGEPSGHVIFAHHATTGDGSLAALKIVECMRFYQKTVSELVKSVELLPQVLKNARVKSKPPLDEIKLIQDEIKKAEKEMGSNGRVILRYSGTEPLVRVMVEGSDQAQITVICDRLVGVLKTHLV